MADFLEIDFLDVETKKSGDAITLRYEINGLKYVHVVDAGYQATGDKVCDHIRTYYDNTSFIDHVVATHPDGDHLGGLQTVLEQFSIGTLWMLRPWQYAAELLPSFPTYNSVDRLRSRLRTLYPNIAALEKIAEERGIQMREPFQGAKIGAFTVLAPTRARYLQMILESDRTPETATDAAATFADTLGKILGEALRKVSNFVKGAWGVEVFSPEETSPENEMSVVQYAALNANILLTADAGRAALAEAADYAHALNLSRPDMIQVPHHGSRRNVSSELLDCWMGPKLAIQPASGTEKTFAYVSSAKEDEHHPRKAVLRAFMHRGAKIVMTEGIDACFRRGAAPNRAGWGPTVPVPYPDEYEE